MGVVLKKFNRQDQIQNYPDRGGGQALREEATNTILPFFFFAKEHPWYVNLQLPMNIIATLCFLWEVSQFEHLDLD